jgi:hypothetical protein
VGKKKQLTTDKEQLTTDKGQLTHGTVFLDYLDIQSCVLQRIDSSGCGSSTCNSGNNGDFITQSRATN